jgi:hypothetical protein
VRHTLQVVVQRRLYVFAATPEILVLAARTSSIHQDGIMTNKHEPRLPITCAGLTLLLHCKGYSITTVVLCSFDHRVATAGATGEGRAALPLLVFAQGVTDGADFKDSELGAGDGELPLPRVRLLQ